MKWEVKLYVGGRVFTEEVYASSYSDAEDAGWDYINSRKTMQAWRGSIRSFDEALAS